MKHKANKLLSFIFALVLMVGVLPISVFATWERYDVDYTTGIVVDWMPDESVDLSGYYADVSALNLSEALDAYKAFTEEEYHEDVWLYTIESFGLYDLNHDGIPELFTLGGGRMDRCKVFTYKNGKVEYVHQGSSGLIIYDNGLVGVLFNNGTRYCSYSYYTVESDFTFDSVYCYTEWFSEAGSTYSVGENAHDINSDRIPYSQIEEALAGILGDAKPVEIELHNNNAAEREAVFANEISAPSDSNTTQLESTFYDAYLGLLESKKQLILDSGKINSTERAVAIADVCGDQTPELIFAAANEDSYFRNTPNGPLEPMWTDLFIYTFDNGELWQIYSCGYDFVAASGSHTRLFQSGVGKALWIASGYGDTYWDETYTRLSYDPDKKVLSESEIFHSSESYQEDRYDAMHDEQTISRHEYTAAIEDLEKGATSWIISSRNSTYWQQHINDSHDYIAMTYDEAVAYLNAEREISIQFDNSSTYVNFKWNPNILFSKEPTGYDKDLAIAGLTLSAAVYHGFDYIDSTFESLGYSVDPHWNLYYDQMDVNWPGHSIYSRPINVNGESKMLITLAIEGTRNIFSQDGLTDVIGGGTSFGIVADNVKSSLDAYVKKYYNDLASNDIIFFITGHSLGGATAGRIAKKLLDAGAPKNNVFCYPIAPPHNTVSILGEECKNIHNIINQCDQVTHMGISQTVGELHVLNYEKYKKDIGDTYKELFDTTIPDNWLGMHECKTYLALLCAVPEGEIEYMLEPSEPGCRVVKILCPVNVEVYNGVGQLVGYNQVNESSQIQGVFLAVVNGDQKYIYLPYDDAFSLRLTGMDDGTMDYIVQNVAYDGTILESIEYSDVQLTKGKIMTTEIGGAIDTSDIELYVVDENGKAIAEVQKDGTEKPLASDNAEKPQKEIQEVTVKRNADYILLVVGIGAIILIGLAVLILRKPHNRNKNRQ